MKVCKSVVKTKIDSTWLCSTLYVYLHRVCVLVFYKFKLVKMSDPPVFKPGSHYSPFETVLLILKIWSLESANKIVFLVWRLTWTETCQSSFVRLWFFYGNYVGSARICRWRRVSTGYVVRQDNGVWHKLWIKSTLYIIWIRRQNKRLEMVLPNNADMTCLSSVFVMRPVPLIDDFASVDLSKNTSIRFLKSLVADPLSSLQAFKSLADMKTS